MSRPLVIGKGSYTRSKTNRNVYYIRHNMGKDPETGKYRYSPRRKVYAKNKSELRLALEEYKAELNSGSATNNGNATVAKYAREFHDLREGTMGSPLSYKREKLEVDHICELFGNYGVRDLRPDVIKRGYAQARKNARFSESELHKIHTKLRQIMESAVNDELILKNPCATISVPRPKGKERKALDAEEASRFWKCLMARKLDSHTIATLILVDTGARRGEALGAIWDDLDMECRAIYIGEQFAADKKRRSPKSEKGIRRISFSEALAKTLDRWRAVQAAELAELGIRVDGSTPVVHIVRDKKTKGRASRGGDVEIAFMDPNNYGRWFRNFCVDNGFGEFRTITHYVQHGGKKYARGKGYHGLTPHMLRHTQATLLIGANVDIKTVSSRLGHSSVKLTLDTYAHFIEAKDREAADVFSGLIDTEQDN